MRATAKLSVGYKLISILSILKIHILKNPYFQIFFTEQLAVYGYFYKKLKFLTWNKLIPILKLKFIKLQHCFKATDEALLAKTHFNILKVAHHYCYCKLQVCYFDIKTLFSNCLRF